MEVIAETAAPVEATTEAPKTEEQPRIDYSSKFAALARKEKALHEQREAIKNELREVNDWKAAREQAKRNPNKFLAAHGLDFETVAKFNLEGGEEKEPSELETIKEKLEKLERETTAQREERERQERELAQRNYDATVNNFKKQIENHVDSAAEKYEFIHANKEHLNDVFELIEIHFKEQNKILDIEQACQLVEEHIENEFKEKYAKLNKLKGLMNPNDAPKKQSDYVPKQQQDIRTVPLKPQGLTNNMTPQANYGKPLSEMSFEERKRHAAAMLKFK